MPDTATALPMTRAQLATAGTHLLGFYLGGGGVKVDALVAAVDLVTRDAAGGVKFTGAEVPRLQIERAGVLNWFVGGSGVGGDNSFLVQLNGTDPSFIAQTSGNNGTGTSAPQAKWHVKSSGEIMRLETTVARGGGISILTFYDPTGRKALLGYPGADDTIYFLNDMNAAMVLGTNGAARWVIANNGHFYPGADNAYSLGLSSNRASVIYAVTGTINTCDIRLKFYRAEPAPTPDEHAAVLECFDAFGFFQHLDAIERENAGGSLARWHFGPKAQEVWMIFASHGLAAVLGEDGLPPEGSVPPAFLCFDAWGEETAPVMAWWRPSDILGPDGQPVMVQCGEGEEGTEQRPTGDTYVAREAGNIFGIRIDQLQSLMLVALNKERKDHAERLALLEGAA
jgi:hypothetical protein